MTLRDKDHVLLQGVNIIYILCISLSLPISDNYVLNKYLLNGSMNNTNIPNY